MSGRDAREAAALAAVAGAPVSRETLARLVAYADALHRWSQRINLVSPATLPALWQRHVLDSAQLLPFAGGARGWLDIGSGGGFPGAVMAILLAERPETSVHLVESNAKKAAFLGATLADLGVAARIHRRRVEACAGEIAGITHVSARAVAALPDLLALTRPWLGAGARGFFHKGRDYRREVAESAAAWTFDLVEHASKTDPGGVILEVATLRPRDDRRDERRSRTQGP